MLINEGSSKATELERMKEVKVKIPVRYHMILLSMKVLHGKQISDAVNEALMDYFAKLKGANEQAFRYADLKRQAEAEEA